MKAEKILRSAIWQLEFRKDVLDGMTQKELVKKYRGVIDYEELLEKFVWLYLQKQELKGKLNRTAKILFSKDR